MSLSYLTVSCHDEAIYHRTLYGSQSLCGHRPGSPLISRYPPPQAFNRGGPYYDTPELDHASTYEMNYEMNDSFAGESEDSKGYASSTFSDFPSTSHSIDPALSQAGQTCYTDFRDLGPAGGSILQSVRQQPLPNMTCNYWPMRDSMPRYLPAFQVSSDRPVASEEDWFEDEGPMEPVRFKPASPLPTANHFGHPDSGFDEYSIDPLFPALDLEHYTGFPPHQSYRTDIPKVFEESLADAPGKAGNSVVSPPTGSHSTLVNPSEPSSLEVGIASSELENDSIRRVISSQRKPKPLRPGQWELVLTTATHSKRSYACGYLNVAPLYEINDGRIEPTIDGLAAFARKYVKSLVPWERQHLTAQVDDPTQEYDKYKERKAKELCCNQVLLDWYKEELETASERDLNTLQSWKKSKISEVFEAKAGTRLAVLFEWDRLEQKLTRSWGKDPARVMGGYRVTYQSPSEG